MKRLLTVAISTLVGLVLGESAVRLFGLGPKVFYYSDFPNADEIVEVDSWRGYRLRANLRAVRIVGAAEGKPASFRLSTNSLGFRGADPPSVKDTYRILALGDSCTFGVGVEDHETWPAVAEQALNQGRAGTQRFVVLNAAVPGYAAWQGARLLATDGQTVCPQMVVVSFGNNDGPLHDDKNPLMAFPSTWSGGLADELAERIRILLLAKHAFHRFVDRSPRHPCAEQRSRAHYWEEEFGAELAHIAEMCSSRRVRLMFVPWPVVTQVTSRSASDDPATRASSPQDGLFPLYFRIRNQSVMRRVAESTGNVVVDVLPELRACSDKDLFLDGVHANRKGLRIIGRVVARAVQATCDIQ